MINLYEILQEVLNESVSTSSVDDVINNKYRVLINYDDEHYHATGIRLIEPYAYGYTKAGNLALRGYQYNGDTARGVPKWKLFRLDRIISWKPTTQKFNVEPKNNGWNAEPYNPNGDGLITVLNQVNFDNNNEELYSPNNRLNNLRKRTDNIKQSTPINVSQFQKQPKPNQGGPVDNNVTQSVSDNNKSEFQKMLDRNLELTRKEKEKRGFSLSNDNIKRGPIGNQQITSTTTDNTETNDVNNNTENNKSEFQKMLDRNLELTRKEKEKRGFSLNNRK